MIVQVEEEHLPAAAEIHAAAWRHSHSAFCSEAFVKQHTAARQKEYLQQEIREGKQLYMLVKEIPVGIVSVQNSLIENLYVLPSEQRKGYGSELLRFAIAQCGEIPRLWILNNNKAALAFYRKHGFHLTGNRHPLSERLCEWEMSL